MSAALPQHGRPRLGAGVYDPRSTGVGQVGPGPAAPGPASSSARPGWHLTCSSPHPAPAARLPARKPSSPALGAVFRDWFPYFSLRKVVENMRGVAPEAGPGRGVRRPSLSLTRGLYPAAGESRPFRSFSTLIYFRKPLSLDEGLDP